MMNPNMFMYDDGRMEDTSQLSPMGIRAMGHEQNRQRRNAIMQENMQRQMQPGQAGPLKGLFDGLGLGGSPEWDAMFGAMQGKENAVQAQGGKFKYDPRRGLGTTKAENMYNPTWNPAQNQSSAVGGQFQDKYGNKSFRRNTDPILRGLMRIG